MDNKEELPPELVEDFVGNAHGNLARVRELLEAHPELLNARARWEESAIEAAAHTGRVEIARFLLKEGAPMDICTAAMLGESERVREMLEADPSLAHATGAHGIPLLFFPAITGQREIAALLVEQGTGVNEGAGGNTALHGAALFNQTEMVDWLLEQGADPSATNYEGKRALELAEASGHEGIAARLRSREAEIGR